MMFQLKMDNLYDVTFVLIQIFLTISTNKGQTEEKNNMFCQQKSAFLSAPNIVKDFFDIYPHHYWYSKM